MHVVATRQGGTSPPPCLQPSLQLRLLDGFDLVCDGAPIDVQPRGQRLLALLALRAMPLGRSAVATTLWPDTGEDHALANLRSTLWRLHHCRPVLTGAQRGRLQLGESVGVDVWDMVAQARRLTDAAGPLHVGDEDLTRLCSELLPDWSDEWVSSEREWLRQLQLHALERLAERLLESGRFAEALGAGLTAVAADPLRESAQRVVISIHLSEGNVSEAMRQYATYCRLLQRELGVAPSPQLQQLIAGPVRQPLGSDPTGRHRHQNNAGRTPWPQEGTAP
jgi:DNA-binding SARP family transcriptional activator